MPSTLSILLCYYFMEAFLLQYLEEHMEQVKPWVAT